MRCTCSMHMHAHAGTCAYTCSAWQHLRVGGEVSQTDRARLLGAALALGALGDDSPLIGRQRRVRHRLEPHALRQRQCRRRFGFVVVAAFRALCRHGSTCRGTGSRRGSSRGPSGSLLGRRRLLLPARQWRPKAKQGEPLLLQGDRVEKLRLFGVGGVVDHPHPLDFRSRPRVFCIPIPSFI